jgi:glycosyltransferase involved in cell wall biosynthesis
MKTLVLITSQFPFGTSESFVATELPFLAPNFKKIIIIAQNTSSDVRRRIPENIDVFRYNPSTSARGFLYIPVLFILNSNEIISMLKNEIDFRLTIGDKFTIRKFFYLFKKIIKSFQLRDFIIRKLTESKVNDSIVFYSYWLKTGAHAISLLNYRNSIKIARGHGSDIYEEKTTAGYLPLLRYSAQKLDAIFFISNQGKEYFMQKTKIESHGFLVSYLGVEKPFLNEVKKTDTGKFVILSCSHIVALKRINLIIDALEITNTGKELLWLHFGDGSLKSEMKNYAEKKLGKSGNKSYRFMGHYPHEELIRYYATNQVDLFLNTSSTEGVPVSIMEAQSFSIPVIATDAGGVKEIVVEGTGSLLPVDFRSEDLASLIQHYASLSADETDKIRMNTYMNWTINFNAAINYNEFIMRVNTIFASSIILKQS